MGKTNTRSGPKKTQFWDKYQYKIETKYTSNAVNNNKKKNTKITRI